MTPWNVRASPGPILDLVIHTTLRDLRFVCDSPYSIVSARLLLEFSSQRSLMLPAVIIVTSLRMNVLADLAGKT